MRKWYPIVLITATIIASVVVYPRLPDRVPTHWNMHGQIDGYGPKWMTTLLLPVVLAGIWTLLNRTSFGRVVRAGIQRPDMVAALGIRLQPYMTTIVMLGVGMAALGGALFAPIAMVHPAMGAEIITVAFVVVVIGGLGSFWGVVLAAMLVGVVRGITIHFVPAAGEASIYVLMFLVLMFRPRGLLGERIEKFE